MLVRADCQQQLELLLEQGVVVLQPESEKRKRLDGRPTIDDHLRTSAREQIEGGEVLKGAHRVLGAQHGDRAGQTNTLRPCRGGAEDDGWSRIQELATVVFTNAKRVEADRVGVFDLLRPVVADDPPDSTRDCSRRTPPQNCQCPLASVCLRKRTIQSERRKRAQLHLRFDARKKATGAVSRPVASATIRG
jgi:hypothetical protein